MSSVHPANYGDDDSDPDDFIMPVLPDSNAKIEGYGSLGVVLPEPVKIDTTDIFNVPRPEFKENSKISEDEAKNALAVFIGAHCCYGSGILEKMQIKSIKDSETYRYCLQTFIETRKTEWAQKPYRGEPVNGPQMGPPPGPWDLQCHPTTLHVTETRLLPIPNTEQVQTCVRCHGMGQIRCRTCHARGYQRCNFCHGQKSTNDMTCSICHGSGETRCYICFGSGMRKCTNCDGTGQLLWFIQLVVNFINHEEDYLKDTAEDDIPDELIRLAVAQVLFSEMNLRVQPINHYHDPDINKASVDIIALHQNLFGNQKILSQKHQVTVIPISKVDLKYNEVPMDYHVYGLDKQVFFPDFPDKCCCGCTIL